VCCPERGLTATTERGGEKGSIHASPWAHLSVSERRGTAAVGVGVALGRWSGDELARGPR
jgi:hypothetical protein